MAFGIGNLTPEQFRQYTPAELQAMIKARIQDREQECQFQDNLNAVLCTVLVQCHFSDSDATPEDFMIMRHKSVSNEPQSPDEMRETMDMLAIITGGAIRKVN